MQTSKILIVIISALEEDLAIPLKKKLLACSGQNKDWNVLKD